MVSQLLAAVYFCIR